MAVGTALNAAVKLVADAATDVVGGAKGIAGYANLLPDLIALLPQIGQIGSDIKALQAADYDALLSDLASYLNLPAGKTSNVVQASVKLLEDLATDIEAVIQATKT